MRRVLFLMCLCSLCGFVARAVTITGQVVDESQHPVAGAQVVYTPKTTFDDTEPFTLTCDANGVFTIPEEAQLYANKQGMRLYGAVAIKAPGYAASGGFVNLSNNTFVLKKASPYTLLLTDATGAPLSNARVIINALNPSTRDQVTIPPCWWEAFSATSNSKGAVALPGIPAEGDFLFVVDDPRAQSVPQRMEIDRKGAEGTRTIRMQPGISLRGRVLAEDGTPVPHIRVSVNLPFPHATVETSADGSYRISQLANGTVRLSLSDPAQQWLPAMLENPSIELDEGKTETVVADLKMRRGAMLTGTVSDAATHQPLRRVGLSVNTSGFFAYSCATDAEGKYRVLIPAGKYAVSVDMSSVDTDFVDKDAVQQGTVQAAEVKTVDFALHRGMRLSGVVQDEQGKPMSGMTIYIQQAPTPYQTISIDCDDQGRFKSPQLQPGGIRLMASNYWSSPSDWQLVSPTELITDATKPLTVVIRKNLHGRVVNTRGEPLKGVQLECTLLRLTNPFDVTRKEHRYQTSITTTSTENGEFAIPALEHGDTFSVTTATMKDQRLVTRGTMSEADGRFSMSDTVMVCCDATLRGRVLSTDGKPLPGASVFSPDARPTTSTTADAQGNFTLSQLPPGTVTLIAATAKSTAMLTAPTGDDPVTITVHPVTPAAPQDVACVMKILRVDASLPEDQRYFDHAAALKRLVAIDPTQANALQTAEGITVTDEMRAAYIAGLMQRDAAGNANKVPTELELITTPLVRCQAAINAGIILVKVAPIVAEHCAALAEGILRDEKPESVYSLSLDRIFLCALLQHADVAQQLDQWEPIAKARNLRSSCGRIYAIKSLVAPTQADTYLAGLNDENYTEAVFGACRYLQQYAPTRIDILLPALRNLGKGHIRSFSSYYGDVYAQLGKYDAAEALACARGIESESYRNIAMVYAVRNQPADRALALYQEALKPFEKSNSTYPFTEQCELAALAAAIDPQVGRHLFDNIKTTLSLRKDDRWRILPQAKFGYYFNVLDPVEARLAIESSFAKAKDIANNDWSLCRIPAIMASIDTERALTMLTELRQLGLNDTMVKEGAKNLIDSLLAKQDERSRLLNDWN